MLKQTKVKMLAVEKKSISTAVMRIVPPNVLRGISADGKFISKSLEQTRRL